MVLLLASAAGAAMPAGVDLDDIGRWEDAAERLLDLPSGCWEWVGEASWNWDVGRFGGSQGDAVFAGRTAEGVWGSLLLKPLGEDRWEGRDLPVHVYDVREARFAPLVGSLEGSRVRVEGAPGDAGLEENAEATNTLRSALARLSGDSYASWVEWDDLRGGVVLHRALDLERGHEEIAVTVFFPGGAVLPTELDVVFPPSFRTGRVPRWTVKDAEVHVRGTLVGGEVFPSSETFSFDFSVLGWTFHGAQTVAYKSAHRCAPPASPAAAPTVPAAEPAPAAAPTEPVPATPAPG